MQDKQCLKCIVLKMYQTNCYLLIDNNSKEAMLIDFFGDSQKVLEELNKNDAKLKYIYLTHLHYDHILGVNELKEKTGAKILISDIDGKNINNPKYVLVDKIDSIVVDEFVNDKDKIKLGENEFEVIKTPGHTKGSTCLYNKDTKTLFSGDTLFKRAYGRCDLPSGDKKEMTQSLSKLLQFPDDTKVLPGHGDITTIKEEKMFNY